MSGGIQDEVSHKSEFKLPRDITTDECIREGLSGCKGGFEDAFDTVEERR